VTNCSHRPHFFITFFKNFKAAFFLFVTKLLECFLLVIDGAPQVVQLAINLHEHLFECHRLWLVFKPSMRRFRISDANNWPKRCHQNLTVS
jgi:hypothetical protein